MPEASPKVVNRAPPPVPAVQSPGRTLGRASPHATTRALHEAIGGGRSSAGSSTLSELRSPSSIVELVRSDRLYRARSGQLVELPEGMTQAEASKLEAEANAAAAKLGQGPPPEPVPDVTEPPDRKEKPKDKPRAKGKRAGGPARRGSVRSARARAALKDIGGKTAQYLLNRARPVLARGSAALARLSRNEQTHDSAAQKRQQAERAVVEPGSESQARSNTTQIGAVEGKAAPHVDETAAKRALQTSLLSNVPRKIEDVDNFKRDMKGQHVGAAVLEVTQADKNAVVGTFAEMEHTPPPAPPEHTPEPLPPPEAAPGTAALNLGQGAIAPLEREHTDVSKFTRDADAKLTEEGVTREQLEMVDSGDLASANRERRSMQQMATTEPAAIAQFARQETVKVDVELKQEEKKQRDAIGSRRRQGLNAAGHKQRGAKTMLEKKREEVAAAINAIHQTAQQSVKRKLADLETRSMKRFDDGNTKAAKEFEDDVNREIDAFKADRYSGWFGWARRAKDWLLGMDDLPAVKSIFERNRAAFVAKIEKLVAAISEENKRVIRECKAELAQAKAQVKDYVSKLGPALEDVGKKAAAEMDSQLQAMDGFISKKEEELQQKLADKQQAAIKAIDEKIEKMKEAMSGALAKLGKLLLWAAKKFFTWALSKFGYSLAEIEGIISKGAAVLKAIFTKPIVFVKNLVRAAMNGFQSFKTNFLKHLKDALFEWLTGSLEGLKLPATWNLQGIVSVALQMVGISYANIRRHMVNVMGERAVVGVEKTVSVVRTLISDGPMAAWAQLEEMADDMREAFVSAVKDFIKRKIIEQAVQWVVSLFIPGAGIIKAIIGIYDTIVFFIQKAKQIATMVGNFLSSIGEIAAGNIGAAATALENGLARGLSLVISFLAALLRLNGVTSMIRGALQKVHAKVDAVLARIANWIAAKAGKLVSKAMGGDPNATPQQRLDRAMSEGLEAVNRYAGKVVGVAILSPLLTAIRLRHRLKRLDVVLEGKRWSLVGEVNPAAKKPTEVYGEGASGFASKVKYGPPNRLGATRMTADPIGPDLASKGSRPSDAGAPPIWQLVNKRRNGRRLYVLGHLLNQRLGGTGDTSANLTPISFSMNSRHFSHVESNIVEKVGTMKKPKWFFYDVKVKHTKRSVLTQAEKDAHVVPEEAELIHSLDCKWHELVPDTKDPTKLTKVAGSEKSAEVEHIRPPYPQDT